MKFVLTAEVQFRTAADLNRTIRDIKSKFSDQEVKIKVNTNGVQEAKKQMDALVQSTDTANTSADRLAKTFAISFKRFVSFSLATRAVGLFTGGVASALDEAIKFERQLLKVSQVTGKSFKELRSLTNEIERLATNFGVTSEKLLGVSTILSQAGLSADETRIALQALAKTELSPTFDDISQTAEGAVAVFNQFREGAAALEKQFGSINAVSGQYAVESGDLISVIRRVGGVFKTAGGNLNELLALFTSVRATTRESAESIATGLRTIFVRVQRPKTLKFLEEFGVKLTDLEGRFVGPYEATKRLSEAFKDLPTGDPNFIKVAEEIAGFRQIGKVIPLIQQFAVAQGALNVAKDGQNSLDADAIRAQEALAVRITKVKEEFLVLIRSVYDSPVFQFLANSSLQFASALIKVADSLKDLIPLIGVFASIQGFKLAGGIIQRIGPALKDSKGFNSGGLVGGVGNTDTVKAMLTPGEFVINKRAVAKIGIDKLRQLNGGGSPETKNGVVYANNGGLILKKDTIGGLFMNPDVKRTGAFSAIDLAKELPDVPKTYNPNDLRSFDSVGGEFSMHYLNKEYFKGLSDTIGQSIEDTINKSVKSSLDIINTGPINVSPSDLGEKITNRIDMAAVEGHIFEGYLSQLTGLQLSGAGNNFDFRKLQTQPSQVGKLNKFFSPQISPNLVMADAKRTATDSAVAGPEDSLKSKLLKEIAGRSSDIGIADFINLRTEEVEKHRQEVINASRKNTSTTNPIEVAQKLALAFPTMKVAGVSKNGTLQKESGRLTEVELQLLGEGKRDQFIEKLLARKSARRWGDPSVLFDLLSQKLNTGGFVNGVGNTDTVPAMLTPGEFVINKKAAAKIGLDGLNKLNNGNIQFANSGGIIGQSFGRGGDETVNSAKEANQALSEFADSLGKFGVAFRDVFNTKISIIPKKDRREGLEGEAFPDGRIRINPGVATKESVRHEAAHQIDKKLGEPRDNGFAPYASQQKGTFQNVITEKLKVPLRKYLKAQNESTESMEYRLQNEEIFADLVALAPPKFRAILVHTTNAEKGMKILAAHIEKANQNVPGFAGLSSAQIRQVSKKIIKRNRGGSVPGIGSTDTVPAMLTPGEFVINKEMVKKVGLENLIRLNGGSDPQMLNSGGVVGLNKGGLISNVMNRPGAAFAGVSVLASALSSTSETFNNLISYGVEFGATVGLMTFLLKRSSDAYKESRDSVVEFSEALGKTEARRNRPNYEARINAVSKRDLEQTQDLRSNIASGRNNIRRSQMRKNVAKEAISQDELGLMSQSNETYNAKNRAKAIREAIDVDTTKVSRQSGSKRKATKRRIARRQSDLREQESIIAVEAEKKRVEDQRRRERIESNKLVIKSEEDLISKSREAIKNDIARRRAEKEVNDKAINKYNSNYNEENIAGTSNLDDMFGREPRRRGRLSRSFVGRGVRRGGRGLNALGGKISRGLGGAKGLAGQGIEKIGGLGNAAALGLGALATAASITARYLSDGFQKEAEKNLEKGDYSSFRSNSERANQLASNSSVLSSAGKGVAAGAALGTFLFPVVGTAVGAALGGVAGAALSKSGQDSKDVESKAIETMILEDATKKAGISLQEFSDGVINSAKLLEEFARNREEQTKSQNKLFDISQREKVSKALGDSSFDYGVAFRSGFDSLMDAVRNSPALFIDVIDGASRSVGKAISEFAYGLFQTDADRQLRARKSAELNASINEEQLKVMDKEGAARRQQSLAVADGIFGNNKLSNSEKFASSQSLIDQIRKEDVALSLGDTNNDKELSEEERNAIVPERLKKAEELREIELKSLILRQVEAKLQLDAERKITKLKIDSLRAAGEFNKISSIIDYRTSTDSTFNKNDAAISSLAGQQGQSGLVNSLRDQNFTTMLNTLGIDIGSEIGKSLQKSNESIKENERVSDGLLESLSNFQFQGIGTDANSLKTLVNNKIGETELGKNIQSSINNLIDSLSIGGLDRSDLVKIGEAISQGVSDLNEASSPNIVASNQAAQKLQKFQLDHTKEIISLEEELQKTRLSSLEVAIEAARLQEKFGGRAFDENASILSSQNALNSKAGVGNIRNTNAQSFNNNADQLANRIAINARLMQNNDDPASRARLEQQTDAARTALEGLSDAARKRLSLYDQELAIIAAKNKLDQDIVSAARKGDSKGYESANEIKKLASSLINSRNASSLQGFSQDTRSGAIESVIELAKASTGEQKRQLENFAIGLEVANARLNGFNISADQARRANFDPRLDANAEGQARAIADSLNKISQIQVGSSLINIDQANIKFNRTNNAVQDSVAPLQFSRGGLIPGFGNRDTVPAMLTRGEYVIKNKSVNTLGKDFMDAINNSPEQFLNSGGVVGRRVQNTSSTSTSRSTENSTAFLSETDVRNMNNFMLSTERLTNAVEKLANSEIKITLAPATVNVNVTSSDLLKSMTSEVKDLVNREIGKKFVSFADKLDRGQNPKVAARSV